MQFNTLIAQRYCFLFGGFGCDEPQAIAIVGIDWPHRAAKQGAQRHVGRFRQRIPSRHVETGNGNCRQALIADKMQRLSRNGVQLDGERVERLRLTDHLEFALGELMLRFRVEESALPEEAEAELKIERQACQSGKREGCCNSLA